MDVTIAGDTTAGDGDMVTVTIKETYDLSTTTGKIGLIAVHTPGVDLIKKLYPGLMLNYKKYRADKCDIALACASLLPADPLQVGTETGDIAPQDLFNPILYRAVSSDSFNTIMNRIYGMSDLSGLATTDSSLAHPMTAGAAPFPSLGSGAQDDIYYALLSESGWKKAMPQQGLVMNDLVPLVYQVVNTFGNTVIPQAPAGLNSVNVVDDTGAVSTVGTTAVTFRGHCIPMPAVPTISGMTDANASTTNAGGWSIPVGTAQKIPKTFVSLFCLPPSKLHRMFFRMTIRWTVSFFDLVSTTERGTLNQIQTNGAQAYVDGVSFVPSSKELLPNESSMVDVSNGMTADMIMQS